MAQVEPQKQIQSRTGKRPIVLPKGVQVTIAGHTVSFKGPKGELKREFHRAVKLVQKDGALVVSQAPDAGPEGVKYQGLARALAAGCVEGVQTGFTQALDLHGVGYRAEVKGQELTLGLGYSHAIKVALPKGVTAKVEIIDEGGTKRPRLHLESANKELLGQTAARVRSFRKPEPYKGKGVRYLGEKVREKAGKAGKAAGA